MAEILGVEGSKRTRTGGDGVTTAKLTNGPMLCVPTKLHVFGEDLKHATSGEWHASHSKIYQPMIDLTKKYSKRIPIIPRYANLLLGQEHLLFLLGAVAVPCPDLEVVVGWGAWAGGAKGWRWLEGH